MNTASKVVMAIETFWNDRCVKRNGASANNINDQEVILRIENDFKRYIEKTSHSPASIQPKAHWERRMASEGVQLFEDKGSVQAENLRNFRRLQLLVKDRPRVDYEKESRSWNAENWLIGMYRGERQGEKLMLIDELEALQNSGYAELLFKYPSSDVGNPIQFHYQGFCYTFRWIHHVYYLGLLRKVLGNRLNKDSILLDIGTSYGIFPLLYHKEFEGPAVLVDFPEQLVMAHYFLKMSIPGCRIAGFSEVLSAPKITRNWINNYDFVLLPCDWYDRLGEHAVDLVTNFSSFIEMPIAACRQYWNSAPFKTAKYFFTVSGLDSFPAYQPPISVIDFPLRGFGDPKRFHLDYHPMFVNRYVQRSYFWFDKQKRPPIFEYIGEIQ